MFLFPHVPNAEPVRRGIVLLVVLALLTLFAVVGLSFVFYAESEAHASRLFRESENADFNLPKIDPEMILSYFMMQFVYDVDDVKGVYSAMRGNSLGRNTYGHNPAALNTTAFNGTGRIHTSNAPMPPMPPQMNPYGKDDYTLINYTYFPADTFIRDPERYMQAPGPLRTGPNDPVTPQYPYKGGHNVPWTYPDLNNLFLAAVNADGEILVQSFHRPWLLPANWWADTNPWTRYMTLRPLKSWNPQFDDPPDAGGDVKNLDWAQGVAYLDPMGVKKYHVHDSFWMDLGFPVMQTLSGKKFKPLFAALIIDLDGKLSLNVHGNIRGAGNVHASNHGIGSWEVNLRQALTQADAANLFKGNAATGTNGRYGPDQQPSKSGASVPQQTQGVQPKSYSFIDYDGVQDLTFKPSSRAMMPALAMNPNAAHYPYPFFPPADYKNADIFERTNHPSLFNPFNPNYTPPGSPPYVPGPADDRVFGYNHLEALLRYPKSSSPSLSSDLLKLCPLNFANPADPVGSARRRRLVTTNNFDLGRPGSTAWLSAPTPFQITPPKNYPTGPAVGTPSPYPPPTATGEFGADGRSLLPLLGRLDLNRQLWDYPTHPPAERIDMSIPANAIAFNRAQNDRFQLAKDIFDRLRMITTGALPSDPLPVPTAPDYPAHHWLAQLAVNIVDYRDVDDYVTGWIWHPDPANASRIVFGTEMPRVLLNEAYAELRDAPAQPGISFWVELINPQENVPNNAVELQIKASPMMAQDYAVYKLIMVEVPAMGPILDPTSQTGAPLMPMGTFTEVTGWKREAMAPVPIVNEEIILPLGGNYVAANQKNEGFYVIGPKDNFPGTNANPPTPTLQISPMTRGSVTMPPLPAHNIFLRRLAIPHMPHDNNFYLPAPAPPNTVNPLYNPYITVDYIQNVATKDGRTGMRDPFDMCKAKGKRQPYAGHSSQVIDQTPDSVPGGMIDPWTDMPQHTFFRHNAIEQTSPPNPAAPNQTLQLPFDWLAHLDRQLTSPVELLQVSNFKPYELTQKFIYPDPVNPMGPPVKHGHVLHVDLSGARYPVWFDPTARLYRFFEFLERGGEMAGVSRQGRVPGLVNLNTIWDIEVFRALCDANGASNFTPAQVDAIFAQMLNLRTPDPNRFPAAADRPFRPLSTGNLPLGDPQHPYLPATSSVGINDTLFREDGSGTGARLFQVPGPPSNPQVVHPYQQMELLNKIFNNVTTRSNTFAVWLTVGFFEVTDDTVNPPRLGKEIGKDENKQVRHRFFAVIDRTQLTLFAQGGKTANGAAIPGPGTFEIQVLNPQTGQPTLTGQSPNGTTWNIQAGMTLEVNTGNATEVVVVTGFPMPNPNNSFFATFTKAHPANFPITCRGNMGPWIQPNQPYEVRKDQQVVPFYTVIQ